MPPTIRALAVVAGLSLAPFALAADIYVAPDGSDANTGTKAQPFKTIQKAARTLKPGDRCLVRAGTYRQAVRLTTSGQPGKPIRFEAAPGETVTLCGTDPVHGPWRRHKGKIYATTCKLRFPQLFVDGQMLVEARWPNMQFPAQLWDLSTWATAAKGSAYGRLVDPDLAKTGIDWTGATAVLNVAHQFFTWTRKVTRHEAGQDAFEYPKDMQGITHYAKHKKGWADDRYVLFGKLEALDAPGEWFHDTETDTLYVWLPDGSDPTNHRLQAKVRNNAFMAGKVNHVELRGFRLVGATVTFKDCDHVVIEGCRFRFPTFVRTIWDPAGKERWLDKTLITGSHNTVRRCHFEFCAAGGLSLTGKDVLVEDNLIHDVSWYGSLRHVPLRTGGPHDKPGGPAVIRHNTVHSFGNAGVCFSGQKSICEYNHVYDGGLCCLDVSLVYTQLPMIEGSVIRYNWVHGCWTSRGRGLGIRGDDQTRGLTVHHNVVWDCGRDGIIVKGDRNKVCNNTVLDIGKPDTPGNYISLHTRPEPKKPWRKQWPLLKAQNQNSVIFNNAAHTITSWVHGKPFPPGDNIGHNCRAKDLKLVDPKDRDFRPAPGSPLIDAGRVIPGITDGFKGKAPDIGAYEHGGRAWVPGITWAPDPSP